MIGYLTIQQSK